MITYDAVALRYCPDPVVGEFVAVALLIVGRDASAKFVDAGFFFPLVRGRVADFFKGDFDGDSFSQWRFNIKTRGEAQVDALRLNPLLGTTASIEGLMAEIYQAHSGVFCWGEIVSGIDDSFESIASALQSEWLTRHLQPSKSTSVSDEEFWSDQAKSVEAKVAPFIGSRFAYDQEVGVKRKEKFHLGWRNGVKQFLEPLSFICAPDTMREKSDRLAGRLSFLSNEMDFRCTVLVAPPKASDQTSVTAYSRQKSDLAELKVVRRVIEPVDLNGFLEEALKEAH